MRQPLNGVGVIDTERGHAAVMQGPLPAQVMADCGAEVTQD